MTKSSNVVVEICIALDNTKYLKYVDMPQGEFDNLHQRFSSHQSVVKSLLKFEILDLIDVRLPLRDAMRVEVYKFQIATEDQVPEGFFISGNT